MDLFLAPRTPDADRVLTRASVIVVLALVVAVGVNHIFWSVLEWPLGDLKVYLAAAERLRAGEPLYLAGDPYSTYWYSPWFAVAMIPMTVLPIAVTSVLWSVVLVTCSLAAGIVLWRIGTPAARVLALLTAPALVAVSAGGNVQALLVLSLLLGLHRRSGPIWVALAASLKFTPVLFILVYAARRQWTHVAWSLGLTALLVAPALAMGLPLARLSAWEDVAPSVLAWGLPAYLLAVGGCCVAAIAFPRHSSLAAATGAVVALPRLFVYDVTLVAAGVATPSQTHGRETHADSQP